MSGGQATPERDGYPARVRAALWFLALGSFAIGTDGYVIGGILPLIGSEFKVSETLAGQLVTVFAITYAVSAPIVMTCTTRIPRTMLLYGAMTLFVLANVVASIAPSYAVLAVARVAAGVSAASYMNVAVAVAAGLAEPGRRGRALAIVVGGLTVATALGVPLGSFVAAWGDWRFTFAGVAVLALAALVGVVLVAGGHVGATTSATTERLSAAVTRPVLGSVASNLAVVGGSFVVYTYFAYFVEDNSIVPASLVSAALLLWGVAGAVGTAISGRWADQLSAQRVFVRGGLAVVTALVALGVFVALVDGPGTKVTVVGSVLVAAWGLAYWLIPSVQVQRTMEACPTAPTIAVSLSSASSYFGVATGSAVGGWVLRDAPTATLPWVAAVLVVVGVLVAHLTGPGLSRDRPLTRLPHRR